MSLCKFTQKGTVQNIKGWARPAKYEAWLHLLQAGEYDTIVLAMNAKIDCMDVVRAQYVVCDGGGKWRDEYQKVLQVTNGDPTVSSEFIGLILWDVMGSREEDWAFHKFDKTIVDEHNLLQDIKVMEYFRVQDYPRTGRWRNELVNA